MGLFDHLFKPKPEPAGEEIVEAETVAPEILAVVDLATQNAGPSRPDPSTFLHPKNFIPRAGSPILPAPKSPLAPAARFGERKLGPSVAPAASDEIVLTLGDILSRIPSHYLKSGSHDPKRELRFKVHDLSSDIARGRAAVPLSSVARLLPDIFVKEIAPDEDTEIRLPLQKLVEQIGLLRSRPAAPVTDRSPRQLGQPPDLHVSPELETPTIMEKMVVPVLQPAESVPARETLRELRPDSEKVDELRRLGESLRASFFAMEKAADVEPAAEEPAIVSIPRVEPQVTALVPEPTREAEPPPLKAPDVLSPAPVEPAAVAPKPAPLEVLASSFAQALAIESEKQAVVPIEQPEEPDNASEQRVSPAPVSGGASVGSPVSIELPSARPGVEPAKESEPVVEPQAGAEGVEERIHLSLAAILRQCPREIIVGQLPPVDDSIRITLPFAPIDRQLNTGKVEVSAMDFVAALPARFQKFFTTPPDLKVPIPLEEVFQNLPTPGAEILVQPEMPPSLVLAPAPENIPPMPLPADLPEAVAEPVPAAVPETNAAPPEPTPAPAAVAQDLSQSASVEKPAVESSPSPPDAVPSGHEPIGEASPSVSEIGPATIVTEEGIGALHLPAFHVFAPPPPLVTFVESRVQSVEATTLDEKPGAVVSEAQVDAVERSAPVQGVAMSASPASPERESATALRDHAASREQQGEEAPIQASEAPVPAPAPEPQIEDAAAVGLSAHPAPTATESAETPPEAPEPKLETAVQSDATGVFAAATKIIVPLQMIRPLIMAPPPLFGFTPAPETPAVEVPESERILEVSKASVDSDFKLFSYDDTENTKVVSDEFPVAPGTVSPPDPSQPELFNEPPPGVEAAGALEVSPGVDAPSAFREMTITISGQFLQPAPPVEADGAPQLMPVDFQKPVSLDESLPHPSVNEPIAVDFVPSETTLGSPVPGAEADLLSAEVVPPEGAVVAAIAPAPFSETEAESAAIAPPPSDTATAAVTETEMEPPTTPVAEVIRPLEEDSIPEPTAEPLKSETKLPEPAPALETEEAASVEEPPAAASGQVAAAVPIIPPPPLPLLPLPRLESVFGMSDVIPPPALQLRRLDQEALQALFMTEETLDLPKISRLAASLPGVYACVIATRDQAVTGGTLPEGFDLTALLGLAPRIREAASRMPIGALKHFTIYGESYSISFFERRGLSLCAIHRARSFVPGVREKLVAIADELSQV